MLLKLLHCPVSISESCSILTQCRFPVVFVKTKTLCSVASQRALSQHAAVRLNRVSWTSDRCVFQRHGGVRWYNPASASSDDIMNVFDRNTKRKQRNQTADLPDYNVYDYLKDEV